MLSVCGSKLRLIQAHFDGAKLMVRYSPLQDFSHAYDMTSDKIVPLLRAVVGHPVGDTTTPTLPVTLVNPLPHRIKGGSG
jgi:hypothetical protein